MPAATATRNSRSKARTTGSFRNPSYVGRITFQTDHTRDGFQPARCDRRALAGKTRPLNGHSRLTRGTTSPEDADDRVGWPGPAKGAGMLRRAARGQNLGVRLPRRVRRRMMYSEKTTAIRKTIAAA